jgi:uncharacterized protein (TIGR02996 family)
MNSHEAFMQTICENSDDDAPRLVYADWLEENGYELYAEFIRVQIELARTGQQDKRYLLRAVTPQDIAARDALEPRVIALMQREQELKKKHAACHPIGRHYRMVMNAGFCIFGEVRRISSCDMARKYGNTDRFGDFTLKAKM